MTKNSIRNDWQLIESLIDPKSRVAPKIDFGKPLHDMSPSLPKNLINSSGYSLNSF